MSAQRAGLDQTDRIAAFAQATERYAETLDDADLANLYWGKSLGLWQAAAILAAGERKPPPAPRRRAAYASHCVSPFGRSFRAGGRTRPGNRRRPPSAR